MSLVHLPVSSIPQPSLHAAPRIWYAYDLDMQELLLRDAPGNLYACNLGLQSCSCMVQGGQDAGCQAGGHHGRLAELGACGMHCAADMGGGTGQGDWHHCHSHSVAIRSVSGAVGAAFSTGRPVSASHILVAEHACTAGPARHGACAAKILISHALNVNCAQSAWQCCPLSNLELPRQSKQLSLGISGHGCDFAIACRRSLRHFGRQIWYLVRTPKATRMVVLGVALVIYVKARSFLAVDQLVRIYREVSRPLHDILCSIVCITFGCIGAVKQSGSLFLQDTCGTVNITLEGCERGVSSSRTGERCSLIRGGSDAWHHVCRWRIRLPLQLAGQSCCPCGTCTLSTLGSWWRPSTCALTGRTAACPSWSTSVILEIWPASSRMAGCSGVCGQGGRGRSLQRCWAMDG